MENSEIKSSKFLSLVLRHKPDTIGLELDENGWAETLDLIEKSTAYGMVITLDELKKVVAQSDKKRFSFSADFTKIRANQGHSIEVDLQLKPSVPPDVLYHGSAIQNRDSILQKGLQKQQRHHVHLSADIATASAVGNRYGKLLLLRINSKLMHENGIVFYLSENGVWLTDCVLPEYIEQIENN